ncbi:hypothetical protein SAMN05421805_11814 [Saccharopolyspora antimicrobica]|uniref:Uncharacterized protein n=1 Tax=Saccharopolyspora antimicrobica TaxID=455193 RepID=A0A1I5I9M5_9PSEU|nr:hypothetical protein ATL45_3932 [Saccharopolyspora antimicrobica]SFO57295.1 hypothetical protein SAMN05421805_11814 [Saccharopolyspora antimicrobica]
MEDAHDIEPEQEAQEPEPVHDANGVPHWPGAGPQL